MPSTTCPEGRPPWKAAPIRVGLTPALMTMACVSAAIVVSTGSPAKQFGRLVGLTDTALSVRAFATWPVLALLATGTIALLHWAAPNVKGYGITWVPHGEGLALPVVLPTCAGVAWYIANFGSFDKTYGAFSGVIVFLTWLWLTGPALADRSEADQQRRTGQPGPRAMEGGRPAADEPYLQPGDNPEVERGGAPENAPGHG